MLQLARLSLQLSLCLFLFARIYLLIVILQPNGLAHLPPIIARQLTLKTTFSAKWPPRTRAEGGQVEMVLGRL